METRVTLDHGEKLIVAETMQDVEPILERNKILRSTPQPPRRRGDWGRHIASIPNVIITRWLNEEWERGNTGLRPFSAEFDRLVACKLRDPDWAYLRTDNAAANGILGFGS